VAGSRTAIAFFGAIVFLPRWFQFVQEVSPTESGLYLLPLMGGVIISSIGSGILVSRTGHFKWLVTGSLVVLAVGLYLSTGLDASTEMPTLWLWMFICGLGVGPTLSVFTIVVQASVPFDRLVHVVGWCGPHTGDRAGPRRAARPGAAPGGHRGRGRGRDL
jgi:hypothetical protein